MGIEIRKYSRQFGLHACRGRMFMLNIINGGIDDFQTQLEDKKLAVWGCGRVARDIYDKWRLQNKIQFFVDNDATKTVFETKYEKVPVIRLEQFIRCVDIQNTVLLISPIYTAPEIIAQLDNIQKLNGLDCYIARMVGEYYEPGKFSFTTGPQIIPKKIHYCWFGGKEKPEKIKRCMDSWYKYCTDYEIIEWNESTYDVTKERYMCEAYENKQWSFVSDYARLDIVYNEGGIYLDTDVELLKSPDELLCDEMYCGALIEYMCNTGIGFGAIARHPLIRKMRDYYDDKSFYNDDGSLNLTQCTYYQDPVLQEYGFDLRNRYQKIDGVVYYPSEVLNPKGMSGFAENFTDKTISIHHGTALWLSQKDKTSLDNYGQKMKERLIK